MLAAWRLGIDELPAIRLDHLSGGRALELEVEIPEFSAIDIGFEATDIDLAIGAAAEHPDEPALIAAGPPVTRPGDLWRLGLLISAGS